MANRVVIIGAGLAGMMAAYAAQQSGAEVVLVDRSGLGLGSNSAMSNGRFAGPTSAYSAEDLVRDTLRVGKKINHVSSVERLAQRAPESFDFFCSLGFELEAFTDHYFVKSSRSDIHRGVPLVRQLAQGVRELKNVRVVSGFYATRLIRDESRLLGVRGIDRRGRETTLPASSAVLAAGGAGAIYLKNDNQKSMLGQGFYLAARSGLELWDMEFVQFYPVVMSGPRLPAMMVYPPYPREAKIIDHSGEDLLGKYAIENLDDAMRRKRDTFSKILYEECCRGPVFLDFRKAPASAWETPPLKYLNKLRFDFKNRPVEISPGAHFFMGGLRVDETGQTALPGLYACGEILWGIHGANRLSGNALTECLVSGMVAGRGAAADDGAGPLSERRGLEDDQATASDHCSRPFPFRRLRQEIREIAWNCAGIIRDEAGLKAGLNRLVTVDDRLNAVHPEDVLEKWRKEDLKSAAFVLKAVLTSSLARKESRGALIRREFPLGDLAGWRKNSCLRHDPRTQDFFVSHHAVSDGQIL